MLDALKEGNCLVIYDDINSIGIDSTLDEGTALKMLDALIKEKLIDLGYGHEVDMIPSVCNTREEGHVLVTFYGDSTYEWFERIRLNSFDLHYAKKSMHTNNQTFITAVGEAEVEVKWRATFGLTLLEP
ncbi:hypothetical protein CsSME_00012808 [Camellia sinensis var. sinensis]